MFESVNWPGSGRVGANKKPHFQVALFQRAIPDVNGLFCCKIGRGVAQAISSLSLFSVKPYFWNDLCSYWTYLESLKVQKMGKVEVDRYNFSVCCTLLLCFLGMYIHLCKERNRGCKIGETRNSKQ